MPYTKNNWSTGDTITEALLNAIEQGIADAHAGDLDDDAIDTAKIALNAVTQALIASGAVGATQLASNAVTAAKIASGAVTNAKLASGAVTNSKIDTSAVNTTQLASDAVKRGKVADGEILKRHIEAGALPGTLSFVDGGTQENLSAGQFHTLVEGLWLVWLSDADMSVVATLDGTSRTLFEGPGGGFVPGDGSAVRVWNNSGSTSHSWSRRQVQFP